MIYLLTTTTNSVQDSLNLGACEWSKPTFPPVVSKTIVIKVAPSTRLFLAEMLWMVQDKVHEPEWNQSNAGGKGATVRDFQPPWNQNKYSFLMIRFSLVNKAVRSENAHMSCLEGTDK